MRRTWRTSRGAFSAHGVVQPIVARLNDKTVIAGHQRLIAARRLGMTHVPVIFIDVSADEGRLLNLALNRISGDWDKELLARLLADLDATPNIDLSLTGFDDDEIAKLLKNLSTLGRSETARRPSTSTPPGRPPRPTRAFSGATCGAWAITGSCAGTRRPRPTLPA